MFQLYTTVVSSSEERIDKILGEVIDLGTKLAMTIRMLARVVR